MLKKKYSLKVRFATLATVMILAVSVIVSQASPAAASANGCSWWNPITIQGHTLSTGRYCVYVVGRGNYVSGVVGQYFSAIPICNWNITAEFFSSSNHYLWTASGPMHYSCSLQGTDAIGINSWQQTGYVCSTLKENGSRITSWCAAIHP